MAVKLHDTIYIAKSSIHGRGVFARHDIARGQYVGTLRGEEVQQDGVYVLWQWLDGQWHGRRGRNALRYLNHHKRPNTEFIDFELFACRNILRDKELTIDYGWE